MTTRSPGARFPTPRPAADRPERGSAMRRALARSMRGWIVFAVGPLLWAALSSAAQLGDAPGQIRLAVRDASRALQAANAPLFLAAFDRQEFAGYGELREQVTALVAQRRIASSVAVESVQGGPVEWTVDVDWLIELTHKLDPSPPEQRRDILKLRVRKRGRRWRVVDLQPLTFFAALPDP